MSENKKYDENTGLFMIGPRKKQPQPDSEGHYHIGKRKKNTEVSEESDGLIRIKPRKKFDKKTDPEISANSILIIPPDFIEVKKKKKDKDKKKKSKQKVQNGSAPKKIPPPPVTVEQVMEDSEPRVPNVIAEHLKSKHHAILIKEQIHFYNEEKGYYEPQSDTAVQQAAMGLLDTDERLSISPGEIKSVKNLITSDGRLNFNADDISFPHLVNCLNGVVDVLNNKLLPHSPEYCFTYCINAEYEEDAEDYYFSDFIDEITMGDKELRHLLSEWTGYMISDISSAKKAGILFGPSNSGKSLFSALLTELLGNSNVTSVGLDKMNDPKYIAQLMDKRANIVNELSSVPIKDFSGFKQLTSDLDEIVSRKLYENPKKQRCRTKLQFSTNHLPPLEPNPGEDLTPYFNRLLILPFEYVVKEEDMDKDLICKLKDEKNAMFMWALKGLKRYLQNNTFSKCERSEKILAEYRTRYNVAQEFIHQIVVIEEGSFIFSKDLETAIINFCMKNNIKYKSKIKTSIRKALKEAGLESAKYDKGACKDLRGFKGGRLLENIDASQI